METIFLSFAVATVAVLFFGAAMANWIMKIVEKESDRTIQEAQTKYTGSVYPLTPQRGPRRPRSPLSSSADQSRPSNDRRHSNPAGSGEF